MADDFLLNGLDNGWFSSGFEEFHLFGFVGDRARLLEALTVKSIWRKVVEAFAPRVNIATIVNSLTRYPLLKGNPDKTLAKTIIDIVTAEENRRQLTDLLALTYRRGHKRGTYFDRVSKQEWQKSALFRVPLNELQNRLITVEGQLVNRSAIVHPSVAATLRSSTNEWVMADFPPHCFVDGNSHFDGKVLLLREDDGFSDTFGAHLPFSREVAWYPYVRITGFFDASKVQTELMPTLSISLVEYRRPKVFRSVRADVKDFFEREIGRRKRIYLAEWSDLVLAAYLVPIQFAGSNLKPSEADAEIADLLKQLKGVVGVDLPSALNTFYAGLPS